MLALMIGLVAAPVQTPPQPTLFDGMFCASVGEYVASQFRSLAEGPNASADAVSLVAFADGLARNADGWAASYVQTHPPTEAELSEINSRSERRGAEIEAGGGSALLAELERCQGLFVRD